MREKLQSFKYLDYLLLFVISIAIYLPLAHKLGYYKDDWYLMYAAHTQGPVFFKEIFAIDRPARGFLLATLYPIFGNTPLFYSLSAWTFRLLSSTGFLWIVRMIWPKQRMPTLLMATLFLIFPGYLSQINAIDFQAHAVSMCFAMYSIALSIRTFNCKNAYLGITMAILSILLGWGYLALVEYSIGLEIFRLVSIAIMILRQSSQNLTEKLKLWFCQVWVFFFIPLGFFLWRILIFQNERKATDLLTQISQFFTSPLTGFWGMVYLFRDMFNVIVLAWGVPLYQIGFQTRLRDTVAGLILALAVLLFVNVLYTRKLFQEEIQDTNWQKEAFLLGFISVFASIIPVILTNRHFNFEEYSRYGLPGSAGAALIASSVLYNLSSKRLRMFIAYTLIFIAVVTHYANAALSVISAESVREFWWQVSWRVPQIEKNTTLVARYAESSVPETYVVWGPANLIYYPEKQDGTPIELALSAVILSNTNITNILFSANGDLESRRSIDQAIEYDDVLVFSQPSRESCVHAFNSDLLEFSLTEDSRIMLVASKSDITNILSDVESQKPPESIFGLEPEHGWCYYFQKADLARQRGEWEYVIQLWQEAEKNKLQPNDQIELMPFLQAYAYLGDMKRVKQLSTRINTEEYYKNQACQLPGKMKEYGYPLSPEMHQHVSKLFCGSN